MKKKCLFATIFLSICCAFIFAGCSFGNPVKSIGFLNENEIVIEIGKFDYNDYKILVTYTNGKTEELTLTEDMISTYEKLKFYQEGQQTVNIEYMGRSCKMQINVKRATLENIVLKNKTVTYSGEPYKMEVEGDIPADVVVRYPNGNTFTNAGTYDIKATCYGDNYTTKELSATLTIKKANYDLSNIKFEDATFNYDKTPKAISINGELPEGVSVSYKIGEKKGNSETNVGEYTVVASFTSKNINYEQIPDKTATLTIKKAKFAEFDLNFANKNETYTGHSYSIEADLTKVPNGVSAYYTIQKIKNAKGENVDSAEAEGNSAVLAGTYIVRVNFVIADIANYESIEPKTATLVIDRAVYVLENAYMYSNSVVYDGTEKSIALSGENATEKVDLPFGVDVSYSYRQIKDELGNELTREALPGNAVIDAGTYEIVAHLTSTNENYKEIEDISAILEIKQAEYKNVAVSMYNLSVVYDGLEHFIEATVSNLPNTVTIVYTIKKTANANGEVIENPIEQEGNSATEVGTYEISATFVDSNKNYVEISSITATLVISEVE